MYWSCKANTDIRAERTSNRIDLKNISLWEGVLILKGQYTEQATITAYQKIFHFGRVYWTCKANTDIRAERTSKRIALKKIFHFGRVFWSWKANTHEQREQATITYNNYFLYFLMYFHPKICSCPYGNKWQDIAVIYTFLCISSVKICSCPEKYAVAQLNYAVGSSNYAVVHQIMQLPIKLCSCPMGNCILVAICLY